jgi:hypothetical protein
LFQLPVQPDLHGRSGQLADGFFQLFFSDSAGDEVEDIGITLSMLVGAIKFIRADKEKGGKK